ncbi:flagellar protein FliT [Ralstonia insidiosa]|jgi:flagellar protein FliT|uniref:Flagellar protein FliT n=1 Tax=Ralstonia insidiosa TaxID=190721 RepID=A0A192A5B4_9RALS|nr:MULTISPECIES: flagellar protein FliT [Ralstonia]ANH76535.1 flagellar FliT family protein [Ralstonia insidiosa]ANJ75482.1 flagellar assembly protein FliT [Ralstonia insidiosa]EPX99321.1 flagellar assembly protein FliT [Ralstonia sp. AU12-08]KAB0469727.1 flagellar protein FliT [Ralstonia insidiosa]MBY4708191.1 flagellar protein FliT [Ralstonia insidiosa]
MHRNIPIKDSESLFVCYEAIARLTAEMVNAAEVGNWEIVSTLESESAAYVDALRRSEPHPTLSRDDIERKRTLLVRILEDDARVRAMVYPRLDRLQKRIDTARRANTASNAYGSMARY